MSKDQSTNPAAEWIGGGWRGLSCVRQRRASGRANENDSLVPPSTRQTED